MDTKRYTVINVELLDEWPGPKPPKPIKNPTWEQLVEFEPKLQELYDEAAAIKDDGTEPWFCANHVWYCKPKDENGDIIGLSLKQRMELLVGWYREDLPQIKSRIAYDVAYKKIYSALPDCRNCACF